MQCSLFKKHLFKAGKEIRMVLCTPLPPSSQTLCAVVSFNCCSHNTSHYCHLLGTEDVPHNFSSRRHARKCCLYLVTIIWLDTGHALSLCKSNWSSLKKLWLNPFGTSWCSCLSGGVRSNPAAPGSESIILPQVWYHAWGVCLWVSSDKWFFQSFAKLKGVTKDTGEIFIPLQGYRAPWLSRLGFL